MSLERRYKQQGMALLEVLVAMLIFALAILPLVRLQVMSMDATKAGYYRTETSAAAQSVVDYFFNKKDLVFDDTWYEIVAIAGAQCSPKTTGSTSGDKLQKTVCEILNGDYKKDGVENSMIHNSKNALICIYKNRNIIAKDQRQISVRAIWYVGKRAESTKKEKNLNRDLKQEDCGEDYTKDMDTQTLASYNIDYLKIDMVY